MAIYHKIIHDIYEAPLKIASKVNFRQYMTNRREPAVESATGNLAALSEQSDVIGTTYPRKKIFRRLALNLRLGKQK